MTRYLVRVQYANTGSRVYTFTSFPLAWGTFKALTRRLVPPLVVIEPTADPLRLAPTEALLFDTLARSN